MLSIKWKKSRYVAIFLFFVLLLNVTLPFGTPTADAAQTGIGSRVVKISAGSYHSLALKTDGTVVAWGQNAYGQTTVPGGLTGVVSIAAGAYHSLALKSDGTVVAWGSNGYGQTNVPVGLTGVVSIAAGTWHSLALKSDGTVVAWGDNYYGQTTVPPGLNGVVSIAGGGYHSLALKSDGTVVAWGWDAYGQSNVPGGLARVVSIAAGMYHSLALKSDGTVVAWGMNNGVQTNVPVGLTGVVSIAAGGLYSLALKSDGTVDAWGNNASGQTNVPAGLTGVVSIAGGGAHSLALKSDGTVVAWGYNEDGETNVPAGLTAPVKGSKIAGGGYHSLALKSDSTVVAWGQNASVVTTVPAGLTGVVSIAAGDFHSLALKSDGTVDAWGNNASGQTNVPAGLTEVVSIAAGGDHSMALKSDGTVVAWGDNWFGQSTVPVGLTGVVSIATGAYHSLALKSDGTVVAWGDSNSGKTNVPAGLNGVASISAGGAHSLALKSDSTVVAWGSNSYGQSTVPGGLTGVVSISAGANHSLALKSDGTVVAWGDNYYGQTTVPPGLNGVVSIAAGGFHSLALKSDGTVVAWGYNVAGQTNVPGNDNLSGLNLQEGSFDTSFSPSVTSYTYSYIGASVSSVNVTAELADMTYAALYVNNQPQASGSTATVNVSGASTVIPVRVEPYLKPGKTYTITVLRDSTPPVVQFGTNGNALPAKTAASKVTVTDTESGVDASSLQYAWTQSTATPATGWTSFTSGGTLSKNGVDGDWYLHVKAQDAAGNTANVMSNRFRLDNTEPTINISMTNADMSAYPDNTWSNQHVTISVTATDANSVVSNVYSMNGGTTWIPYTVAVALQEGVHSLTFKAVDVAGNEAVLYRTVKISTSGLMLTPTMTTSGGSPYPNGVWSGTSVTVSVYAQAGLSGIASLTYTLDRGPWQNYANQDPLTFTQEGQHTMVFQVVDTAGNTLTAPLAVNIDLTAPSISFGTNGNESWSQSGSTIVTVTDAGSEVDTSSLQYAWTTDTATPAAGWTSFASGDALSKNGVAGDWYLHIRAQDGAGNTANAVSNRFRLDNTAPVISFGTNGNESLSQSASTTVTVTDAESGVDDSSLQYAWTTDTVTPSTGWTSFANGDAPSKNGADGDWYLHIRAQDGAGNTANAVSNRFRLDNTAPVISFGTNGNESWSQSGSTTVTVTDAESGVDTSSLQYAWTTDTATPAAGWTSFASGDALSKNGADGDWYLHIRAQDGAGNTANAVSNRFRLRAASTESHSYVPDMKPVIDLNGGSPEPTEDVFNSSIVNETNLVKTIESKVVEAKEANATIDFADTQGHWAEKTIDIFVQLKLINGYDDGTFRPNNPITRAEFAAILNRAFNIQGGSVASVVLKDIGASWAKEAIENLVAAGVINGYADGTFKPDQTITREEMVIMLSRIVNLNNLAKDQAKGYFNDLNGSYAASEIKAVAQAGIVSGKGDGSFDPKSNATRAEALQIILNVLELNPQLKKLLDSLS